MTIQRLTSPAWMRDALCAQVDPELFFPDKGGGSTQEAKKVCARCPVAAECLDYALEGAAACDGERTGHGNPFRFGIWGGVSERDRRGLEQQLTQEEEPA